MDHISKCLCLITTNFIRKIPVSGDNCLKGKPTHCRGTCEAPLEERHDSPPLARREPDQDLTTQRAFQMQFHSEQPFQITPKPTLSDHPKTQDNPAENNCLEGIACGHCCRSNIPRRPQASIKRKACKRLSLQT